MRISACPAVPCLAVVCRLVSLMVISRLLAVVCLLLAVVCRLLAVVFRPVMAVAGALVAPDARCVTL